MKRFKALLIGLCALSFVFALTACNKVLCGEFSLKTPVNIYTNLSITPTLTWEASENATKYQLTIATNETMTEGKEIFNDIIQSQYTFTTALAYETTYYWNVKAISEDGKSIVDCKSNYSFTTTSAPLSDFSLTLPLKDAIDVNLQPELTWESLDDNAVYKLVISKKENIDEDTAAAYFNNILTNSYKIRTDLARHMKYYWKVEAEVAGQNKTCSEVFSFTTADKVVENYENYDETSFNEIYTIKELDNWYGQSITTLLETTPWAGYDNGKSLKIVGNKLIDWSYLQILSSYKQMDLSGYDGITFTIYPKIADERLGMIVHVVNGCYPDDCMANFSLKGNAPSKITIPFNKLSLRDNNTIGSFNATFITGLWFTFKSASVLGINETGFTGTYPNFEIYIDDICGYSNSDITEITYEAEYTNEFAINSLDLTNLSENNIDVKFEKSGANNNYTVSVSENSDMTNPVLTQSITAAEFIVEEGKLYSTYNLDVSSLAEGTTYYVSVGCGDYSTPAISFDKIEKLSYCVNFEDVTTTAELKALCNDGVTDIANNISLSETSGVADSNSIKFATATTDSDIVLKGLWDFKDFDYLEFYYNIPSGKANFYLRLYLNVDSTYSHRAYLDFSTAALQLSGSGYLRIPMVASNYSYGGGATVDNFSANNIKALGFYVKNGSSEFYIDNINLYKEDALTEKGEFVQAMQLRNSLCTLENGTYSITLLRNNNCALNKTFTLTDSVCSLTAEEFDDVLNEEHNYIVSVYKEDGSIVWIADLNIKNSLLIDFNNYTEWQNVVDDCAGGVLDTSSKLSLSTTGGFNDTNALMVTGGADSDTILKQFWDYPDFDYLEFYYNIPTGSADFFLRLYLSSAYTVRGFLDYDTASVRLTGSGIIRIPVNALYLSAGGGATTDLIKSENIKGFGIFIKTGSSNFYIDNIKLIKEESLTSYNLNDVATLRTGLTTITTGTGYRLVVEKSYSVGSFKTLYPVVNKVFDISTDILTTELEDVLTTGNYIYTVYAQNGSILSAGTLTVA